MYKAQKPWFLVELELEMAERPLDIGDIDMGGGGNRDYRLSGFHESDCATFDDWI